MSTAKETFTRVESSLQGSVDHQLLVVDDEPNILSSLRRFFANRGYGVEAASRGDQAIELIRRQRFGVIISDIRMPQMSGIQLLRSIREHDLDVPVILITGDPDLDSAIEAIEFGAFRYLTKPYDIHELARAVETATKFHRLARIKRLALEVLGIKHLCGGDRASTEGRFLRGLESIWMAHQPIVDVRENTVRGYEALLRTRELSIASPEEFIDVAVRLGQMRQLGRAVRRAVASSLAEFPRSMDLFINLHTAELMDDDLYERSSALGQVADRIVLEISDRIYLEDIERLRDRVLSLKEIGFRIALDNLGVGLAGLTSLTRLEPEMVKIDRALVSDLDQLGEKQHVVRAIIESTQALDMQVIAEGVETTAERDALIDMGCVLHQGYLFGVPS